MPRRKPLTEQELLELIEAGLSDVDASSGDEEGDEGDGWEKDSIGDEDNTEVDEGSQDEEIVEAEAVDEELPGPSTVSNTQRRFTQRSSTKGKSNDFFENNELTRKENIKWKKNVTYITPPIQFYVRKQFEDEIVLETPMYYFLNYFTEELFHGMSEFTNLYTVQNNVTFLPTNTSEMKQFVGINIIMGNTHYPRIRNYWEPKFSIPLVANTMPQNRFYKLRQNLHFVDTTQKPNNSDRFWKIRPLYDRIRAKCLSLPIETCLSIDEQMVPFKGTLNVKQYVRGKPNPWGIKIFALCGSSGLLSDFIIYQGSTTELDAQQLEVFGLGASVILKLSERITEQNVQLFFDNYFSNYNLLQFLRNKYIWATCTARLARFKNPPFTSDKEMKKKR